MVFYFSLAPPVSENKSDFYDRLSLKYLYVVAKSFLIKQQIVISGVEEGGAHSENVYPC